MIGVPVALGGACPSLAAARAQERTIAYSIGTTGVPRVRLSTFRAVVDATLNDPRGWSLGGSIRFKRSARGAFKVTLAAPAVVGRSGACSAYYSCRSGHLVLINDHRWRHGAPTFRGRPLLHSYRQLIINHEVGHALGFGHASCTSAAGPAPVMQQQSKGLAGCSRNPWPLPRERATLARRSGVQLRRARPAITLGEQIGGIRLGDRRGIVTARLGQPSRAGDAAVYSHAKLVVGYSHGRVVSVTTRSSASRSVSGLRVGTRASVLRRRLGDARCREAPGRLTRCVIGRSMTRGDAPTTFTIRNGVVVAVRVERLLTDVREPFPPPWESQSWLIRPG